uniref:protein arginine N-methyltransferase 7-like isoform X1 n=1 Tax=Styela clava TaxID=7725 RepID=UPI0019399380|nr:protein arginine N-methyltransferase 7-like isoform X1 [Styela clava]
MLFCIRQSSFSIPKVLQKVAAITPAQVFRLKMSQLLFNQRINPTTGKMEWVAQNKEDYDYFQDVARSSYADMLHDTERNQMYYKAIKLAVKSMHERGKGAKVLDIGTGTGLLSMMAATAGADSITAIEVFEPMAEVARSVTAANGFGKINVINKHSSEVAVGEDKDMQEKANILVTELFDTELIGEGALKAYQHAHKNLMEDDCIAVPHSATTYVQLVESDVMDSWHSLNPIEIPLENGLSTDIYPDPRMEKCPGVPAVHDIQLSQIKRSEFTALTDAVEVFKFEWGSKTLASSGKSYVETTTVNSGKVQVALSWWTLSMDQKREIILSTAPYWYHPTPDNMQWRDHWIQSVYFIPKPFNMIQGETICIFAFHDAYSIWFDAKPKKTDIIIPHERPVCDYLPRMLWSRPRLGMLNDANRNLAFSKALQKVKFGKSVDDVAVCVSDVSLLPLIACKTCFTNGHIYSIENDSIGQKGIRNIVKKNGLDERVSVVEKFPPDDSTPDKSNYQINLLLGEPFFNASFLPWHDLRFWYARTDLQSYLAAEAQILPLKAHLYIAAVEFENLWKIRAPVGIVEGFDVSVMDGMIDHAMEMKDYHEAEPHALWEYPCKLLSDPKSVMTFNFSNPVPDKEIVSVGDLSLDLYDNTSSRTCHGVVLWMVYDLDEEISISTGITERKGFTAKWNIHHKQGVFFLRKPLTLKYIKNEKVDYEIAFIPTTGSFNMKFNIQAR